MKLEIHAADGGKDAEMFALDLAKAIAKSSDSTPVNKGRVIQVEAMEHL